MEGGFPQKSDIVVMLESATLAPNQHRKFIEIYFQYSRIILIFTYRDKPYLEVCPIVEKTLKTGYGNIPTSSLMRDT